MEFETSWITITASREFFEFYIPVIRFLNLTIYYNDLPIDYCPFFNILLTESQQIAF